MWPVLAWSRALTGNEVLGTVMRTSSRDYTLYDRIGSFRLYREMGGQLFLVLRDLLHPWSDCTSLKYQGTYDRCNVYRVDDHEILAATVMDRIRCGAIIAIDHAELTRRKAKSRK
jgi:hypothetical protein